MLHGSLSDPGFHALHIRQGKGSFFKISINMVNFFV